ncbi:MAG: hypothetical protein GC200_00610 [Tepidisphaera sp.]|nr:hypothetical protein [Tepidisphaera sp.]
MRLRLRLLFSALLVCPFLAGCTGITPPRLWVEAAKVREQTDQGAVIEFTIRADNPNADALPLRDTDYSVTLNNAAVFRGVRSAQCTLPGYGQQTFTLPAAVPGKLPEGSIAYRINGEVEYILPGAWRETLADSGLPEPTASLSGEGEIDHK